MNEIDPEKDRDNFRDSGGSDSPDDGELQTGYGGYAPPSGDGNIVDHRFGEVQNVDLESMYVKPTANKQAAIQRRVNMESQAKQPMSGCQIWAIAALVVIGLAIGGLAISTNTVIDGDGDEVQVSNLKWLYSFLTRTERVALLSGMDPEYRRYYITVERIDMINKMAESMRSAGERVLRPEQMAKEGMIRDAFVRDGWGYEIEITVSGTLRVAAPGPDGLTRTPDDIYIDNGSLVRPAIFQSMELERETPGGR